MADAKNELLWVLRAQAGDREAFEALLRATQHSLFRYISRLAGPSNAEDVLQEVLLRICQKLIWLREPELFRAWAFRISSRAAFAFLKRERRWSDRYDDQFAVENLPAPEDGHLSQLLRELPALVDEVSPASRAVLLLHYGQDLSLEEVAAVLEISVGTVKSRLAYGLSCLRKSMERKR